MFAHQVFCERVFHEPASVDPKLVGFKHLPYGAPGKGRCGLVWKVYIYHPKTVLRHVRKIGMEYERIVFCESGVCVLSRADRGFDRITDLRSTWSSHGRQR